MKDSSYHDNDYCDDYVGHDSNGGDNDKKRRTEKTKPTSAPLSHNQSST